MKADFHELFVECYKNGIECLHQRKLYLFNSENESAVFVKEFRPINLTISVYEIITKDLAERLQKVMPRIISSSQSAFIGGRQITNPVLMANEIVEYH